MRKRIAKELKRETFTGRLAPTTADFLKMVPGSNGRKIDYLVSIVKPIAESGMTRQVNENLAAARLAMLAAAKAAAQAPAVQLPVPSSPLPERH